MDSDDDKTTNEHRRILSGSGKVIEPLPKDLSPSSPPVSGDSENPAISLIRQKISSLYGDEPDAAEELQEAKNTDAQSLSSHQKFMLDLSNSGKSLAEIQTAWHNYYSNLPDHEKHKVWQEFYAHHDEMPHPTRQPAETPKRPAQPEAAVPSADKADDQPKDNRSIEEVKDDLLRKVSKRARPAKDGHWRSLLFGLGMGAIALVIVLFGFFNERVIAPFITPSRSVSNTPLVIDPSTTAVGPEPKIIIPKINVEIPVVYNAPSIKEEVIQEALEGGVVHYPITSKPGEVGNGAIFGHSSNNILNKGKYKFAFVLLKELEPGDTFMIHKDGKRYVYKVFDKKIVPPTDISVLGPTDRPATISLITCDPPGTSINRLVVVGEQISPDPATNVASSVKKQDSVQPASLPSDAPSLWERIRDWLASYSSLVARYN